MGRDRDRDRDRYRRRSRSRDRDRDRERARERRRTRSRSYSPRRSKRQSPGYTAGPSGKHEEAPSVALTPEEQQMRDLMGFGSFHSTKGKKVEGNDVGGVHVIMKRKYRQYMNRKGGFNRPLDFVA